MKYRIIKSVRQYNQYCKILEELVYKNRKSDEDEIELLTLLIEKWDDEHYDLPEIDPIQLLRALMEEHNLTSKDLTQILNLSKGTVSKILNYQAGISKETIRNLANHFKLNQDAFNRPYELKIETSKTIENAAIMNTKKMIKQTA